MGGFLFVVAVLFQKIREPQASCPAITLPLPAESRIEVVQADRQIISLLITEANGQRMVQRYDACNGQPLPAIRFAVIEPLASQLQ